MALFDWTPEEKWRHLKHFFDTHTYSEDNVKYVKSWIDFMTTPSKPLTEEEEYWNTHCKNCGTYHGDDDDE